MSKWISETVGMVSKAQLQSFRSDLWRGLLTKNGLDLNMYPWWSAEENALEKSLFKTADQDYEARKAALAGSLSALSSGDLDIYFDEIGVERQSVEDYLHNSPFEVPSE